MLLYLRLLKESFAFAMSALRNNKLRTFLSLLGVTVGIFSIIAILAAVDSLDRKIKEDMSSIDKNTMYLKRFNFAPTDIPEWRREQFPDVTYNEYQFLKNNAVGVQEVAFQFFAGQESIKYEDNTAQNLNMVPVSFEFPNIQDVKIEHGRFYNESESNSGNAVAVIGHEVANTLFGGTESAVDKKVRIYGQRFTVIGVIEKQGSGSMGMPSNDTSVFFPSNFLRNKYGEKADFLTPVIIIKPKAGTDAEEVKAEVGQKLRAFRGMNANQEDNFFIDILSGLTDFVDQMIGTMNAIGFGISAFSLLVGGFGIANIMFVSVKERTNIIGIQKALGAKNRFILLQFLFEAVILSLFGGIIGILMVWGIMEILTKTLEFKFVLSFGIISFGTAIAVATGLFSGILPAIAASRLDPVEAIRSGM